MHPWSVPVDAELLRRLYVDERLTTLEIATRLGGRGTTILRRLRRFEIQARPRGPRVSSSRSSLAWSPELAWAIGLIATDGNLSPDGRHLSIPSKDLDLLESLRSCLGLQNRVVERVNGKGRIYRLQWGDRGFYDYRPLWVLRYAKTESLRVLRWMYYSPQVPSLSRKRHVAAPFLIARVRPPRCGPGRPMVI